MGVLEEANALAQASSTFPAASSLQFLFPRRAIQIAYANNAGHGPATVKLFMDLWDQKK